MAKRERFWLQHWIERRKTFIEALRAAKFPDEAWEACVAYSDDDCMGHGPLYAFEVPYATEADHYGTEAGKLGHWQSETDPIQNWLNIQRFIRQWSEAKAISERQLDKLAKHAMQELHKQMTERGLSHWVKAHKRKDYTLIIRPELIPAEAKE